MLRVVATALLLAWGHAAQASTLFQFNLAGSAPVGAIYQAEGQIQLSGRAFGQGIDISLDQRSATPDWSRLGIELLSFTTNGQHFALTDLVRDGLPPSGLFWSIDLHSGHAGTPSGSIRFNNTAWDVTYRLNGADSGGVFNTDGPGSNGACFVTGTCSFAGSFGMAAPTPIPTLPSATLAVIPEPVGAALLGVGVAGLLLARRRRARAG